MQKGKAVKVFCAADTEPSTFHAASHLTLATTPGVGAAFIIFGASRG